MFKKMKQKIFSIFIILLVQSCVSPMMDYVENTSHDKDKNKKIILVKSLNDFLISYKKTAPFPDKVIQKGDMLQLRYLKDGRKVVITDNLNWTIGLAMFQSDRGLLLDDKNCSTGKLYTYTPTHLGNDEFLIENNAEKSRFKISVNKPCFLLDKKD